MATQEMPKAEYEITVELARSLLWDQHPDLADLDIALVANGWDNAVLRLGSDLSIRMPRRAVAAPLVANEQKWLPVIADRLTVPIPIPIRVGTPALGYPWAWSVTPWFEGAALATAGPVDLHRVAVQIADFLKALHAPASMDAPKNPWRGIPLGDRDELTRSHLAQAADVLDLDAALALWEVLVATEPWDGPPLWLHGDFHPGNIIMAGGEISAVIDFGDITAGDPATDLSVAWMLFDGELRDEMRVLYGGVDDATWRRARGWAFAVSVACIANSSDNPTFARIGFETFDRVMRDA